MLRGTAPEVSGQRVKRNGDQVRARIEADIAWKSIFAGPAENAGSKRMP
jgi:hypothetical protein